MQKGRGDMKVVFVSNYLNHHQIPFCNALSKQKDIDLTFIQMEMMERERVSLSMLPEGFVMPKLRLSLLW